MLDVSNFDKSFTSDEAAHSVLPINTQKKIAKQNDKFKGFDAWYFYGFNQENK